jgi:hypothetical protein
MMAGRAVSLAVGKEIRALLPVWAGCAAAVTAAGTIGDRRGILSLGILIYCVGSLGLGALSIGHEYTGRTLPLLLAQPSSRARLFLVKQGVLLAMLLTLGAVAWITLNHPQAMSVTALTITVTLSVLGGLSVSPLLTMVSRNPVAGIVFTIPLAGFIWLAVETLVAQPLRIGVSWRVMLGLCAIAAVVNWRTFMRLEAKDGRGPHVHMQWSSPAAVAAPARRRHPVWWLVKKELGLQQMTFVVVAIYLLGSLKLLSHVTDVVADGHAAITALYSGVLALLIGSLASAEERQFGTLESQLLLPMASSTQWLVKVVITLGLALLLAVGLPALLVASRGRAIRINEWYVCAILILTVTSLYVSSLCSTGIRALLLSVLAAFLVLPVFVQFTHGVRHLTTWRAIMLSAFLALVLWFGLENQRTSERSAWRIARQVFVMVGCLALGGALLAAS